MKRTRTSRLAACLVWIGVPLTARAASITIGINGAPPDGVARVTAVLHTEGAAVAGTQNRIVAGTGAAVEGCERNPAIGKEHTRFALRPPGCTPGRTCTEVEAIVLSLSNLDPIPDGSVLYSCDFRVLPDAPVGARIPLPCPSALAAGPDAETIATFCTGGEIHVRPPCPGDCDADGRVSISELIAAVNIALRLSNLRQCPAAETDGDGVVTITDLIRAVNAILLGCSEAPTPPPFTPTPTASPTPPPSGSLCGNGVVEGGEECDDGNNLGTDGCAANCTQEVEFTMTLEPSRSAAFSQFGVFGVPIGVAGELSFLAGVPRAGQVVDAAGAVVFEDREAPVAIPSGGVNLLPVEVPGLACVCVGAVEAPERFGPGIGGAGKIGCGPAGLPAVDYDLLRDHNIDLHDDPAACAAAGGTIEPPDGIHPGVCNGPEEITFRGGGPTGSAVIEMRVGLAILLGVDCGQDPPGGPKGDDGLPCTADDAIPLETHDVRLTTGRVTGTILDANNVPGAVIGPGVMCGGLPCNVQEQGAPFDCDRLFSRRDASGAALATVFTTLDGETTGDGVTTIRFVGGAAP